MSKAEPQPPKWIFVVKALNQPGSLTAAAAVFSNRGISLDGILGSGMSYASIKDGRLLFSFSATPEKQSLLKRSLERLPTISQVEAYPFADARLRAIAVIRLAPTVTLPTLPNGIHTDTIEKTDDTQLILLSGSPHLIEPLITQFKEKKTLQDVVTTVITV